MPKRDNNQYIVGLVINRYVLILLGLGLLGFLCWYFSGVLTYVIIAWVASMVGGPLRNLFQNIRIGKYTMGPTWGAALTILTFFVGVVVFVSMFVPMLVEQARNLEKVDYQAIADALEEPLANVNELADKYGMKLGDRSPTEQVEDTLKDYFSPGAISTGLGSVVGIAGNLMIGLMSIVFITFFFLKDSQLFTRALHIITPTSVNAQISHIVEDSSRMLTRYFGGVMLQITIITAGLFIGLYFLDVPNALLIAFLAALFNVIPYVGPIIGAILGLFLTITSHLDMEFYSEMLPLLTKVAIVFFAMQMVDNFILQPFIFSNRVYAHPLEIFIIVLVGAQLAGILGMVIAIPSYTVTRIIARNFLSEFEVIKNMTQSLEER